MDGLLIKHGIVNRLHDMFKNTALEPYLEDLIPFYYDEERKEYKGTVKRNLQQELLSYIDSLIDLATMLRSIKGKPVIGDGWTIRDRTDCCSIYDSVEQLFIKKLGDYDYCFEPEICFEDCFDDVESLKEKLSEFPYGDSFEFEDKETDEDGNVVEWGWKHLSVSELDYAIKQLNQYSDIVKSFYTAEVEGRQVKFMRFAIDKNIQKSRKVYRELYKFMDFFGDIPADVKMRHSKTVSTTDPESNYIKSIVTRAEKSKDSVAT